MTRRLSLTLVAAGALLAAAFGCGDGIPGKLKYAAPPQAMLQSGVSVTFQWADVSAGRVMVHTFVTNMSNQMMMVNRDGWALRLPDGRILQRRGENQRPYFIAPGQGHEVFVKFDEPGVDLRSAQTVSLIVGGISFGNDPTPRVVGELPLTQAGPKD